MSNLPDHITSLSSRHGFVRSAKYDQGWMFDNAMGPNPLWLTEWLCREMNLSEDMTVLDMGCGKALTSIFLAREFGCRVFANDLWIAPEENLGRIAEHPLQGRVFPIRAEAHALPYAKSFFDAIISVDSYQYFGTDDWYLDYFSRFVKTGGQIGIVVPGWSKELSHKVDPKFVSFHTCAWWRQHWSEPELVDIECCDMLPNGKAIWLDSARAMLETKRILRTAEGTPPDKMQEELDFWKGDVDFLEADTNDEIALIRVVARRKK